MVIFGAVGWADDSIKIRYKDNAGLPARKKFFGPRLHHWAQVLR